MKNNLKQGAANITFFFITVLFGVWLLAELKKAGIDNDNARNIITNLCIVLIGFSFFGFDTKIKSIKLIILIAFSATASDLLVRSLESLISLTLVGSSSLLYVAPVPSFPKISLVAASEGGVFLFFVKAMISAPLWEELFRKVMQDGLSMVINKWISLILVAAVFSAMHVGYIAQVIPFFVIAGIMVEKGFSWFERAIMHAISNMLALFSITTIGVGSYQSFGSLQILKVCLFIFGLSIALRWIYRLIKNCYMELNGSRNAA